MTSRKFVYAGILGLLFLVSLANFYRNRDPYRAYFYPRSDQYLTTHLLESEFDSTCRELEYRLQRKTTPNFYRAVAELYQGRELVVENAFLLDDRKLAAATGAAVSVRDSAYRFLTQDDIELLLQQVGYSFFYSPQSFSSLDARVFVKKKRKRAVRCLEYKPPWDEFPFPLLMILLPDDTEAASSISVVHTGKYLFFLPSCHPALVSQP